MYVSFIRRLLEYAEVVWDNYTQYEVNELAPSPLSLWSEFRLWKEDLWQ